MALPTTTPTTTAMDLTISLLGPLRATRGDQELVLGGRRQRAVLARLALAAGSVVGAERLVDELWAGEPPPSAANTLQSYVSNLRRILGPAPGPAIERLGDGYRLAVDDGGVVLSSTRFEQLAAQDDDDLGRWLARLEEGLALWHGDAVAEFADEAWAQGDAVRLEELRMAAVEQRFQVLLDLGRHAAVVGEVETAAQAHPLRERLTALLVLALYRCGRQAEALRAYERTRQYLGDELGLDPGPDLVQLAARVLDHDPALAPARPAARTAGPTARVDEPVSVGVAPPTGLPLDLPPAVLERRTRSTFVGRRHELVEMGRAYEAVADGDRLLLSVAGEPGMGKTRLAQQFATWVHDQGGHVLWGRCTAENLIAYQPAVEAIRTAIRSISEPRAQYLLAPRPALGILLPDLTAGSDAAPSRAERYELYEALADLVGDVAGADPVMFVVDDIQWADASTLSLLDHLVRSERTGRLLVVATQRRPAGRSTTELDSLYADLRRDQRLRSLDLGGIGIDDVAEILEGQGVEVSEDLALALHARTGGNPFFVESLAEHGAGSGRSMPESVRDLLDQRLAGLDAEANRVLTAAAVMGLRVDLGVLGEVVDLAPDDLLDIVDLATAAALLVEDEELGWVTFPHALVRQALVARTTRNREAQLHLRVADALDARPELLDRAANVAQHLHAAGRLSPPERAARAALAAASEALDVLADEEARRWAERAVERCEPGRLRAEADLLAAVASRNLADAEAARASLDRVLVHARSARDAHLLARVAQERALAVAGIGFSFGSVDEELIALFDEALEAHPEAQFRAELLAWSSIAQSSGTDRPRQADVALAASEAGAVLGDPRTTALTLLARRLALAGPEGLDERLKLGEPMVAAAEAAGWTDLVVVGRVLTYVDHLENDQIDLARRDVDDLGGYIAPFGRPGFEAYHLFAEANLALMAADLDRAEALSNRALAVGEPSHAGNAEQAWKAQQMMFCRDRGTLAELAPLVHEMAEGFPHMAVWRTADATCATATGDLDAARAAYRPLVTGTALDNRADTTWYTTVAQLAEVAWVAGDAEGGAVLAGLLAPYAHRLGVTGMGAVCIGPLSRELGLALAVAGDLDGAADALAIAIERCVADNIPSWGARARCELALVLEERDGPGDAERAGPLRSDGLTTARELGVHLALGPIEYGEPGWRAWR
ncbi:MAG: transcriptional regulator, putative ATPase, winged helix family [Acidimicrobiales bacterium]|nr:transcriptional regulator, putative ATPase, winged helix family [Acidimicrobiales bacterium]